MLHSTITAAPDEGQLLTPAAYLQLRRTHAGLSIEQVAERMSPLAKGRSPARELIRQLETEPSVARGRDVLIELRKIYRFDLGVYSELAYGMQPQVCRECGCSVNDACVDADENCCSWATAECCTHCASNHS